MLNRRRFFGDFASLAGIASTWMLSREANAIEEKPHFEPKVKRIVQIFCPGGVSHVDTFDYKPDLEKLNGMEMTGKGKADTFFGQPGKLMRSPFEFKKHGQIGKFVSSLFPHLARHVDDLTFLHAMTAKSSNHTPAAFQMNSGFLNNGYPSIGAWVSYGLGSMNEDLPTFVVLPDSRGLPAGGSTNWSNGFLPATHQGVAFRTKGEPIPDLDTPKDIQLSHRKAASNLLQSMNSQSMDDDASLIARVRSYEMAAKMQLEVPGLVDLAREPEHIRKQYGIDNKITEGFGRNCLLARRLLEKGVRFVQLWHGGAFGSPRINWDAHESVVENHTQQAEILDQPMAGFLADLKARGLMKDTLFLWTTEFGRTPFTQGVGKPGRDHHQHCFTVFMSGPGLRPGHSYGKTDEIGYKPVQDPTSIYDLHATVLHLLGLDHTLLTYYHNGTRRRLTDVHGEVIDGILK